MVIKAIKYKVIGLFFATTIEVVIVEYVNENLIHATSLLRYTERKFYVFLKHTV